MHQTRYWTFFAILAATCKPEAFLFTLFSVQTKHWLTRAAIKLMRGAAFSLAVKASKIWHQQGNR
jgi:hypothetical protein